MHEMPPGTRRAACFPLPRHRVVQTASGGRARAHKSQAHRQHRAHDRLVDRDALHRARLSGVDRRAHRRGRHRAVPARHVGERAICNLRHLGHPLCYHAPDLRGDGARARRGRHGRDAPVRVLRAVFRPVRGYDGVFSGRARGLSLDRRRAHGALAAHHEHQPAVHRALVGHGRVFHRLRPRVEANARAPDRAVGEHHVRDVVFVLCGRRRPGAELRRRHGGRCVRGRGVAADDGGSVSPRPAQIPHGR